MELVAVNVCNVGFLKLGVGGELLAKMPKKPRLCVVYY